MASPGRDNETSDNGLSSQLDKAIDCLSVPRLQELLKSLCIDIPIVHARVTNELLVTYDEAQRAEASTDEDESTTGSASNDKERDGEEDTDNKKDIQPKRKTDPISIAGNKRLRARYTVCENCNEEYDILDNDSESCWYHPEESEPDDEFFAEHHLRICGISNDTPEMRRQYPQGFFHPCCDRTEDEEPCTLDRHRESHYAKRLRT